MIYDIAFGFHVFGFDLFGVSGLSISLSIALSASLNITLPHSLEKVRRHEVY